MSARGGPRATRPDKVARADTVSELQVEQGHVAMASVGGDVTAESADDGAW